jgi:Holliday junction resolvase RusA-like endonuclease
MTEEVYHRGYSDWRVYAIPFFPLSYNQALNTNKGGTRFLVPEYGEYKDAIVDHIRWSDIEAKRNPLFGDAYEIELTALLLEERFFYKNGGYRAFDIDNINKLVIDAFFTYANTDDRHCISIYSRKFSVEKLPYPPRRYSASPVWNNHEGGNFFIKVRTVPRSAVLTKSDWQPLIYEAHLFSGFVEPQLNMNRGKKKQALLAAKELKRAENLKKIEEKRARKKTKKT